MRFADLFVVRNAWDTQHNGGQGMSTGQGQSSNRETTIVDNEVYNLLTVLSNKLQGLAAYSKYQADGSANQQVWQQLRQQDEQAVRQLLQQLEQFAQQGKLKA
jgi:hypothetical protein